MAQRKFPRVSTDLQAVALLGLDDAVTLEVKQLSMGGCLLSSDDLFDTSRLNNLTFSIQGISINAVANPIYCTMRGSKVFWGVSFAKLSPIASYYLNKFINKQIELFGELKGTSLSPVNR
ncbi:MAG: hypothetical protein C0608_02835 [Deltaproteobacteria bacterium]|nr:MAG: hypothetical protein C0608_02835 [Deltaproteobacteria bacterium]